MPFDPETGAPIDSAMARLDEEDYLERKRLECVARDLAKAEPLTKRILARSHEDELELLEQLGEIMGARFAQLEARISELEAQGRLKYVGPWKEGGDYLPGELVSYGGGMWHCRAHTGTRPNKCAEAWQLAVKSGERK